MQSLQRQKKGGKKTENGNRRIAGLSINVNNKIKSTGKRTAVVYRSSFFETGDMYILWTQGLSGFEQTKVA